MIELIKDPLLVLSDLIFPLTEFQVPYVVGGSFASGVHGEFRATQDVDVVVDLSAVDLRLLVGSLSEHFYVNLDTVIEAVSTGGLFNIFRKQTAFKVDFFTKVD